MKPELVIEERLKEKAAEWYRHWRVLWESERKDGHISTQDLLDAHIAGASGALKELHVEKVIEVPGDCHGCKWDDLGAEHPLPECMLNGDEMCPTKGATLVTRAKPE